jgi:hypothetical protein
MTSVEIAEIVDNIYTNYLDHELPDDWTPTPSCSTGSRDRGLVNRSSQLVMGESICPATDKSRGD